MQKEYSLVKPARDAAAKAKMEAEAVSAADCPLHVDNEWNIRLFVVFNFTILHDHNLVWLTALLLNESV